MASNTAVPATQGSLDTPQAVAHAANAAINANAANVADALQAVTGVANMAGLKDLFNLYPHLKQQVDTVVALL